MLTNADCTLYRFNKDTEGYDRYFIPSVFWNDNAGGAILKSGMRTERNTTVYIYSSEHLPETLTKDILVKGECPFLFDNTNPQSVSESFSKFRKQYKFVTVTDINDASFGGLPHYEITSK